MKLIVRPSQLKGEIQIPASKSHTIRALCIASLAAGESRIVHPLESADTTACVQACRNLGATVDATGPVWRVKGFNGKPRPTGGPIDVMNSGTTLRLTASMAALADATTRFDGDHQIRQRPMQSLLDALNNLGAHCATGKGNGCCPLTVKGPVRGGATAVSGVTSQFLSSLLISAPLMPQDTEITVEKLNEKPYVEMTLGWLERRGIRVRHDAAFTRFLVEGRRRYTAFQERIPGDFSSATFPLCAAAITGSEILALGLDMNDLQGDKKVVSLLGSMGAETVLENEGIRIRGGRLEGRELDLNAIPDALPALAVVGCCAAGATVLKNVPQARLKETDRIAVMARELAKMGARIQELPAGLVIEQSRLQGCAVDGHHDHRVVMALSLAGLAAAGATVIETAEAMAVTFPDYVELMQKLGADMTLRP
jgi:3-phosphoshikimate 1-carboxyvinyltransferase